jgi:hypothetical protein
MNAFLNWFSRHRKDIGYVVGGLNLGSGFAYFMEGSFTYGLLWTVVAIVIIIDTKEFK